MSDTTQKEAWTTGYEACLTDNADALAALAGVTVSPGASVKALVEAAQLAITYIDTLWNGNGAVIAQRARDALAGFSIEEAQG